MRGVDEYLGIVPGAQAMIEPPLNALVAYILQFLLVAECHAALAAKSVVCCGVYPVKFLLGGLVDAHVYSNAPCVPLLSPLESNAVWVESKQVIAQFFGRSLVSFGSFRARGEHLLV